MFIFLILIFLLSDTTGRNVRPIDNTRLKIINGQVLDIWYRPFMVSIHFRSSFICGGTIVSKFWVLTAQHCMNSYPSESVKYYHVRAGSKYAYQGYGYGVSRVATLNPNNESASDGVPRNDVALVRVAPKFRFSFTIRPAKLPKVNKKIPDKLWVSGWGLTENNVPSRELRIVGVKRVPFEICSVTYNFSGLNNDQHLCFGGQGFDSCRGDSGGPLADYSTVYGVVSFGPRDCGVAPGVYESVSHYSDWIEYTINT